MNQLHSEELKTTFRCLKSSDIALEEKLNVWEASLPPWSTNLESRRWRGTAVGSVVESGGMLERLIEMYSVGRFDRVKCGALVKLQIQIMRLY